MVVGLAAARKLETNVTLEFAKLNIQLISQFTKMTTNNNLISILSAYVRPTELGGTCFYVSAETLSLESPSKFNLAELNFNYNF